MPDCHMEDIAYIDAKTHANMKRSSLKHGDILMTKTGRINTENSSLGRAALYLGEDDMANVNGHVYFIRLKPGVSNMFVLRILVSPEYSLMFYNVDGMVNGATRQKLTQAAMRKMQIPSRSIEDQKHIVDELNRIVKIKEQRFLELQLLDKLIKARFVEMFENEIEYNKVKLEEIADIVSGITKGRKTKCGELREVPYMAVSNVKDGYIDWTTVKTILATEDEIIQYKLLPDDVLMTEGGDPDKLGRGAIISLPPKDCIHQNHIFRVRLDETQILPRYFAAYLQSSQAKTYFLRAAKQTTGIASINMSQLRGLPTIVPPIELQLKYSLFSEQVDKSKLLSLIKLLEQLITYLYNVFIIYRQDKGEEVERHE